MPTADDVPCPQVVSANEALTSSAYFLCSASFMTHVKGLQNHVNNSGYHVNNAGNQASITWSAAERPQVADTPLLLWLYERAAFNEMKKKKFYQ